MPYDIDVRDRDYRTTLESDMSLATQAVVDLASIVGADGVEVTVTSPAGVSVTVRAMAQDIGQTIDPQTGQAVTGRLASVTIPMASLATVGMPRAIHDKSSKPWVIEVDGARYKVREARPDRTLGAMVCVLEASRHQIGGYK